jgi:hypothetical protein
MAVKLSFAVARCQLRDRRTETFHVPSSLSITAARYDGGMRYSLRTLLIAAFVVPPLLALIWWALALNSSEVPLSAVLVVLVVFLVITAMISGPPPDWR